MFVALAFGLATALLEVLYVVLHWTVLNTFVWTGESMFWMVPLYYVSGFLVLGAIALILSLISHRRLPLWITAGASAAVSIFSLLLLVFDHKLAIIAVALLALGTGVQIARSVRAHHTGFRRRLRPVALALFVIVGLMAAGQPIIRELIERRALANLPETRAGAPNILLIILDTVRAASLGLYGYDQPTTPRLEDRARDGAIFERAIATSSWTLPTHASMFTGIDAHLLEASWLVPFGENLPTLAEVLANHGYVTGGFVANLYYTTRESGLARGFLHYEDFRIGRGQFQLSTALGQRISEWTGGPSTATKRANDSKPGEEVTSSFLNWVDEIPDRPFFAFLNYYDAHRPYRAPRAFRDSFDTGHRGTDRYNTSIAYLDHEIDGLLEELAARGRLDSTIVVLTADHGQLIDDHGLHGHGFGLYDYELHVPFVIWYPPAVPAGLRIDHPVSMRDLPATILDLAGIPDHPLGGTSLRTLLQQDPAEPATGPLFSHIRQGINALPKQPVSRGDMFSIYRDGLHYILNGDSVVELYHLRSDPEELRDLSKSAAWQDEVREFTAQARAVIGKQDE